jgi:hypothetical protein
MGAGRVTSLEHEPHFAAATRDRLEADGLEGWGVPDVGSRTVWPGAIAPSASADSIIALATRSFTEPVGLRPSSLAKMRTSGLGDNRGSSTSGVLPTASIRLP